MSFYEMSGRPFKAEFSGDASTVQTLTLFDPDGGTITLGATERLNVTSAMVSQVAIASAQLINLFVDNDGDGAVDAGERVVSVQSAAFGDFQTKPVNYDPPVMGKKGALLKILASSTSAVCAIVTGIITTT